jgi:NarL family two-component system response regulator LiaR
MDVMMPGVGGLEATRQIKQDLPATKVVVRTSLPGDYTLREAFARGADSFVDKREIATRLLHAIWNAAARRNEPPLDPGRDDLRGGSADSHIEHS